MHAQTVQPQSATIQVCLGGGSSSSSRRRKRKTLGPGGGSDPSSKLDDYGRDAGGLRYITDEKRKAVRGGVGAVILGSRGGPGGAALSLGGYMMGRAP